MTIISWYISGYILPKVISSGLFSLFLEIKVALDDSIVCSGLWVLDS